MSQAVIIQPVHIQENVDLKKYSAMRLGGLGRYVAEARTENDVQELVRWAKEKNFPLKMIGQGSNIIWRDKGFDGLLIINKIPGKAILSENDNEVVIKLGGGEVWDEVVSWSVDNNWSGIEFLSRIPGLVGAAPVQNIGAYGAELSDTLMNVAVFDAQTESFETMPASDCDFSYRMSRFKGADKGRFMILAITLKLKKTNPKPPFYESLENYFKEHNVTQFTPKSVREAVAAIRKIKLPDPSEVANNGSFFTNPIIEEAKFKELQQKYPEIKGWPYKDKVKISAGWMVDKAGFKDIHDQDTGMGTWPPHALVLVNEHASSTADLLTFRQKILDKVQEMFGVTLEQEPELFP